MLFMLLNIYIPFYTFNIIKLIITKIEILCENFDYFEYFDKNTPVHNGKKQIHREKWELYQYAY
jgi:hypothetical protein